MRLADPTTIRRNPCLGPCAGPRIKSPHRGSIKMPHSPGSCFANADKHTVAMHRDHNKRQVRPLTHPPPLVSPSKSTHMRLSQSLFLPLNPTAASRGAARTLQRWWGILGSRTIRTYERALLGVPVWPVTLSRLYLVLRYSICGDLHRSTSSVHDTSPTAVLKTALIPHRVLKIGNRLARRPIVPRRRH